MCSQPLGQTTKLDESPAKSPPVVSRIRYTTQIDKREALEIENMVFDKYMYIQEQGRNGETGASPRQIAQNVTERSDWLARVRLCDINIYYQESFSRWTMH